MALEGLILEAQSAEVHLVEEDPEEFRTFVGWLYRWDSELMLRETSPEYAFASFCMAVSYPGILRLVTRDR